MCGEHKEEETTTTTMTSALRRSTRRKVTLLSEAMHARAEETSHRAIANAQEVSDKEDNSTNTITDVMSNVMGTMQMASNANAQSMNAGMTAMRQEMATLLAEVQASRQALAHNAMWGQPPAAPLAPQ